MRNTHNSVSKIKCILEQEFRTLCKAYSPEWSNTSWKIMCFSSKDEVWLALNHFKAAGLFWVAGTQMFYIVTFDGTAEYKQYMNKRKNVLRRTSGSCKWSYSDIHLWKYIHNKVSNQLIYSELQRFWTLSTVTTLSILFVQNPSNPECHIPLSEPFRLYQTISPHCHILSEPVKALLEFNWTVIF
jgi:hypothetical protein